jgi:hypothetical protein
MNADSTTPLDRAKAAYYDKRAVRYAMKGTTAEYLEVSQWGEANSALIVASAVYIAALEAELSRERSQRQEAATEIMNAYHFSKDMYEKDGNPTLTLEGFLSMEVDQNWLARLIEQMLKS